MKTIFKLFIIICYSLLFISCDEAHTHKYVNGECSCGEKHDCVFIDGKCVCGKIDNIKNEEFIVNFNNTDIKQIKVKKQFNYTLNGLNILKLLIITKI